MWHTVHSEADSGSHAAISGRSTCDHYDFLLETDAGVLLTWRIPCFPAIFDQPSPRPHRIAAERIPNHREIYLDYEGPLSDGRGAVTSFMAGDYVSIVTSKGTPLDPFIRDVDLRLVDSLNRYEMSRFIKSHDVEQEWANRGQSSRTMKPPIPSPQSDSPPQGSLNLQDLLRANSENSDTPIRLPLIDNLAAWHTEASLSIFLKCEDRCWIAELQITSINTASEMTLTYVHQLSPSDDTNGVGLKVDSG